MSFTNRENNRSKRSKSRNMLFTTRHNLCVLSFLVACSLTNAFVYTSTALISRNAGVGNRMNGSITQSRTNNNDATTMKPIDSGEVIHQDDKSVAVEDSEFIARLHRSHTQYSHVGFNVGRQHHLPVDSIGGHSIPTKSTNRIDGNVLINIAAIALVVTHDHDIFSRLISYCHI